MSHIRLLLSIMCPYFSHVLLHLYPPSLPSFHQSFFPYFLLGVHISILCFCISRPHSILPFLIPSLSPAVLSYHSFCSFKAKVLSSISSSFPLSSLMTTIYVLMNSNFISSTHTLLPWTPDLTIPLPVLYYLLNSYQDTNCSYHFHYYHCYSCHHHLSSRAV